MDYLGSAIVASTVANVNRPKNVKPYPVSEFIPKFEKKVQTVDSMLQVAQMMTVAMGGQDMREDTNGE